MVWSRRKFLKAGATASLLGLAGGFPYIATARSKGKSHREPLSFFVVSDTHYDARVGEESDQLVEEVLNLNRRLLHILNDLPGTRLPRNRGGLEITEPSGVIHLGDIIDSGDKNGAIWRARQATEWKAFEADYGLTGAERNSILRFPVYEFFGNHDSTREWTPALLGIKERNLHRPGVAQIEPEFGQHYSWDWSGIHFIALGHLVGHSPEGFAHGRMEPFNSYQFLVDDLAQNVGDSGRPVIILQHVDIFRFSQPCDETSSGRTSDWWHACDVAAYHRALKPYNIAGIFHGHRHGRVIGQWDGSDDSRASSGYRVMGSNNSGASGGGSRAFWYCRLEENELVIREANTTGFETAWARGNWGWDDSVWRLPLA